MWQHFLALYQQLFSYYGPQYWWPADTTIEMMIGAILVQNTNWSNVEKAIKRLKPYLDPIPLEKLATDELAQIIRPSGFYNIKAKRIKAFLEWYKSYDYDLNKARRIDAEQLRAELLSIHGLGPETVDCMLVYAFDIPIFIVDAYARRIFERLGYDMPAQYDAFRVLVESHLSNDVQLYNEYHALLVRHGKEHCKLKPLCASCPLQKQCAYYIRMGTDTALGYSS